VLHTDTVVFNYFSKITFMRVYQRGIFTTEALGLLALWH